MRVRNWDGYSTAVRGPKNVTSWCSNGEVDKKGRYKYQQYYLEIRPSNGAFSGTIEPSENFSLLIFNILACSVNLLVH